MKMPLDELIKLPVFPFAEAFPHLSEEELKELAQDLEVNGQLHPIILFIDEADDETVILDGRNRIRALQRTTCMDAEVEYFKGTEFQAVEQVRALNILRRHLSVGQRAMAALAYLPYEEGEAKRRQLAALKQNQAVLTEPSGPAELESPKKGGNARDIVAEKFNLSGPRISDAKKVALNAPDLATGVKNGELTLDGAVKQLKARNEAHDKKIRELEFEAKEFYGEYQSGRMTLDDAYVAFLNRKKDEARKAREGSNEAIDLIVTFNRIADERLREFNLRIQKLTTIEKVDQALTHLASIDTSIATTRMALSRYKEILQEDEQ